MFLKGVVTLKNKPSYFSKRRSPWVYSSDLVQIDTKIAPGSWVSLENHKGQTLGYGHFNPHSLIAFRLFERSPFQDEDQTRLLVFKKLDQAWHHRQTYLGQLIKSNEIGPFSYRLIFGESDGLPGLIVDLYESDQKPIAVIQSHCAGADQFIQWVQQWLDQQMKIDSGVIRNDLDVRTREKVPLEVQEWGALPNSIYAIEGGVKFFVNPKSGQKTGYFYDHRDNRAKLAQILSSKQGQFNVLDCFSYIGSWGLQILKKNPNATLHAVDISQTALDALLFNAEANGMRSRVETYKLDFFKECDQLLRLNKKFAVVVSDPPALSSSAKQKMQSYKAHMKCFENALRLLDKNGVFALASCSYHLSWEDFLDCVAESNFSLNKQSKFIYFGSQSLDHPVLDLLKETRYLKCVIGT